MPISPWMEWLDLIFPRACALCSHPLVAPQLRSLCSSCLDKLCPIQEGCLRCGAPLDKKIPQRAKTSRKNRPACPHCQKRRFQMTRVFAFTTYTNDAIRIARKMKEPHSEAMARQVGQTMAAWLIQSTAFAPEHYDALVPIPQHWFRRLTLRYNQSEVLASSIAASVGSRVEDAWLQRSRWTQKQGMKNIAERVVNMKDAFRIAHRHEGRIRGRRFLLVDDVMTSGATLDQAALVLKRHGAVMVDAVVFARGMGGARSSPPKGVEVAP